MRLTMHINKDVESWAKVVPSAVLAGSKAQGENVIAMALADIQTLGREIGRLQDAKRGALAIADERAKENERLRSELQVALERFRIVKEGGECGARALRLAIPDLEHALAGALVPSVRRVGDRQTCSDCPPLAYPTDATRCDECLRREKASSKEGATPNG